MKSLFPFLSSNAIPLNLSARIHQAVIAPFNDSALTKTTTAEKAEQPQMVWDGDRGERSGEWAIIGGDKKCTVLIRGTN